MQPQDFPLSWPEGRPRTTERAVGRFSVDFQVAYDSLVDEAEKLHDDPHRDVVVSTNVPMGARGLPLVAARRVSDPGVAVYLWVGGRPYALACDAYLDVHHNLRALAATVAALRTIARHGTGQLFAQSMSGFAREVAGRTAVKMIAGEVAGCA